MGAQQSATDTSNDDFEIINVYKSIDTVKLQKQEPIHFDTTELLTKIPEPIEFDKTTFLPDFKHENRLKYLNKVRGKNKDKLERALKTGDYIIKYHDTSYPQTIDQEIEMHFNHIINTQSFNDLELYIRDMIIKYHSVTYKH